MKPITWQNVAELLSLPGPHEQGSASYQRIMKFCRDGMPYLDQGRGNPRLFFADQVLEWARARALEAAARARPAPAPARPRRPRATAAPRSIAELARSLKAAD